MSRRNRPTAFDLSFGESDAQGALKRDNLTDNNSPYAGRSAASAQRPAPPSSRLRNATRSSSISGLGTQPAASSSRAAAPLPSNRSPAKRKQAADNAVPSRSHGKRPRTEQTSPHIDAADLRRYTPETADTIVVGEEEGTEGGADKPIRLLTQFVIFDPANGNTIASVEELDEINDKHFEAVGRVGPVYLNEEDAGQNYEAELNDAEVEGVPGPGQRDNKLQKLHTGTIFSFSIDYADEQGPVYLQTSYAYYMLGKPANVYEPIFHAFYSPHRIAQLLISTASKEPTTCTRQNILIKYQDQYDDLLDDIITKNMLEEALPTVAAIMEMGGYQRARQSPFMQSILSSGTAIPHPALAPFPCRTYGLGNIDLQVLSPKNQNQTVVTPLVADLAQDLFRESFYVLGPQPTSHSAPQDLAHQMLIQWLSKTIQPGFKSGALVEFMSRVNYVDSVKVNHAIYSVGDVIVTLASSYTGRESQPLPQNAHELAGIPSHHTPADYFWFGKILYIDRQQKTAHVQWFEHASKTVLQEIHNPNELFITETCGSVELHAILNKCNCHFVRTRQKSSKLPDIKNCWKNMEFFYSYVYDQTSGSFTQADEDSIMPLPGYPPDTCSVCAKAAARGTAQAPQVIRHGAGVAIGDHTYHLNDYALVKSGEGSCLIGQIVSIKTSNIAREQGACQVCLVLFGRAREVAQGENRLHDEQELFLTQENIVVEAKQLLRPCKIKAATSVSPEKLQAYLDSSPLNFYAHFQCARADYSSWKHRKVLKAEDLTICSVCFAADQAAAKQQEEFDKIPPLSAFDPFAGVGAFALSMQEAGIVKLTHAVEISPSAAKTLKENSPQTLVYNQCANLVLKSSVKQGLGQQSSLRSVEEKELPPMIQPGDVDCIVAGFPCQPHSTLNMYQQANDRKSHLILTLLSWVDFLRPKHCLFENVRGFIQYSLNTTQHGKYRLKGGIQVGGLKFLVHALLTMGYQVRFSLLEAAHYGTPQARVRFFLIASRIGCTLPSIPSPLYHLPTKDTLTIRFPHALHISPIPPTAGCAPHSYISVKDAIGDLPWFDWHNPLVPAERTRIVNGEVIPLLKCNPQKPTCGMSHPHYRYAEPRTRFQAKARARETTIQDLQHYTRPLKADTVARVTYIGLRPGANFKDLFNPSVPQSLTMKEWQMANPSSAVARRGFKDNFYGRLDEDKWFHTTVTNVEPTAKQSWVLNPWCKRVLTVRELARSQGFPDHFQFYSVKDKDVKTMHREIGNAVPWPVGLALGRELKKAEFKDWLEKKANAIVVD